MGNSISSFGDTVFLTQYAFRTASAPRDLTVRIDGINYELRFNDNEPVQTFRLDHSQGRLRQYSEKLVRQYKTVGSWARRKPKALKDY